MAIVAALATMFRPNWAPATGLVFAVAKGAALAGFSAVMVRRGVWCGCREIGVRRSGCVGRGMNAERQCEETDIRACGVRGGQRTQRRVWVGGVGCVARGGAEA